MVDSEPTSWVTWIGQIGDRPEDSSETRNQHRLLIWTGVMMSLGGLVWGTASAAAGLWVLAAIPYAYVAITAVNLYAFHQTKAFTPVRAVQVVISLALPFLFQWSLGGFDASGAVIVWSVVALVLSLTFSNRSWSLVWLGVFIGLVVLSGVLEGDLEHIAVVTPPAWLRTVMYVANLSVVSAVLTVLVSWVLGDRLQMVGALEAANRDVLETNKSLETKVLKRTVDLAGALARSQAILAYVADGLVAVGVDGKIMVANRAAERLLNRRIAAKADADQVLPPEMHEYADAAVTQGQVVRGEVTLSDRVFEIVASPVLIARSDPASTAGSVLFVRDVTTERQVDTMKTQFISTVSHELRTPLTSILGFAKNTRSRLESRVFHHIPEDDKRAVRTAAQASGNLGIIISEGERLAALIGDLLDISKMESGEVAWNMVLFDAGELIRKVTLSADALFKERAVKLVLSIDEDLPQVMGDVHRLHQVLLNLISNAAKFTDEGVVEVAAIRRGKSVEFSVSDTGEGIAEADLGAVFDRFKQVGNQLTEKPKGTGLGLPICREIVAAHGGDIQLSSKLGTGSRFWFELAMAQEEVA